MKIADLPFHERPVTTLLNLDEDRDQPSRDFAGFGWAKIDRLWLATDDEDRGRPVDDALVLALHSADDGEAMPGDIELEFELPERPVTVVASQFLATWLPRLPRAREIVLALCNPHRAVLAPVGDTHLHYGMGDVASWRESDDSIILTAEAWCLT